jgi:selenoprotein W-related protein
MATPKPVKVTITYCAECGYEPQTLSLTDALMRAFTHQLGSIELVPWYEGSFDVAVNGTVVHAMYRDGGFPENQKIIDAVRAELASATPG